MYVRWTALAQAQIHSIMAKQRTAKLTEAEREKNYLKITHSSQSISNVAYGPFIFLNRLRIAKMPSDRGANAHFSVIVQITNGSSLSRPVVGWIFRFFFYDMFFFFKAIRTIRHTVEIAERAKIIHIEHFSFIFFLFFVFCVCMFWVLDSRGDKNRFSRVEFM